MGLIAGAGTGMDAGGKPAFVLDWNVHSPVSLCCLWLSDCGSEKLVCAGQSEATSFTA